MACYVKIGCRRSICSPIFVQPCLSTANLIKIVNSFLFLWYILTVFFSNSFKWPPSEQNLPTVIERRQCQYMLR